MDKKKMLNDLIYHYSGGRKKDFADKLGITAQGLSTWMKREVFDNELLFSKCEFLNPEWLLSGSGQMILNENEKYLTTLKTEPEPYNKLAHDKTEYFFFELLERKEKEIEKLNRELGALQYKLEKLQIKLERLEDK